MFNFGVLGKGLELFYPENILHDFPGKIFLMLYSINCQTFFVWLLLLLEILDNMRIVIFCFSAYSAINFKINLSSLIKPFFHMTANVSTKI